MQNEYQMYFCRSPGMLQDIRLITELFRNHLSYINKDVADSACLIYDLQFLALKIAPSSSLSAF